MSSNRKSNFSSITNEENIRHACVMHALFYRRFLNHLRVLQQLNSNTPSKDMKQASTQKRNTKQIIKKTHKKKSAQKKRSLEKKNKQTDDQQPTDPKTKKRWTYEVWVLVVYWKIITIYQTGEAKEDCICFFRRCGKGKVERTKPWTSRAGHHQGGYMIPLLSFR